MYPIDGYHVHGSGHDDSQIDVAWKCEHVIVKRYLYYRDTNLPPIIISCFNVPCARVIMADKWMVWQ